MSTCFSPQVQVHSLFMSTCSICQSL